MNEKNKIFNNLKGFIEYLHTNIDYFNQYNDIKENLNSLTKEIDNLEPEKNFKDSLKHKTLEKKQRQYNTIIYNKITQLIKEKAREYKIPELDRTDIYTIKENAEIEDLQIILELRHKYYEFVENTRNQNFSYSLFHDFNRFLKELFDFFDKNEINDFNQLAFPKNIISNKTENNQPQPKETNKPDEVKKVLHNNIFKGNAFEIWQSMFEKFQIIESNYSTDIDFMFQVMKHNNLIYNNIGLTDIKNWINTVYEISFDKIRFTNHKAKANKKRLIIFNQITSK